MKKLKLARSTIILIIAFIFTIMLSLLNKANAVTVNVPGVYQGTDDTTYASSAPVATIIIDANVIEDPTKISQTTLHSNYPGFALVDLNYLENHTYDSGVNAGDVGNGLAINPGYPASVKYLVYDESQSGATKIAGNTGSLNTFSGDIVSYTYNNAALLPDGTRGKVVITYSNISFPMQNNFGQHRDTNSYKAKRGGTYQNFYTNADTTMAGVGGLKAGYNFSDFWGYDATNDRGVYVGNGIYTVGVGTYLHIWNNLVPDAMNDPYTKDRGYTTRNGLKLDIKIQVLDSSGNAVNGTFFYSMKDIDVSRTGNANFGQLYDFANQNEYSETMRVNSGVDSNAQIYIPGDIPGGKEYNHTNVYEDTNNGGIVFQGKSGDNDPGTTYSGFVTLVDNSQGLDLTYWSSGAEAATIRTWILSGHTFHTITSSTGTGGTIKTTTQGNLSGALDDGYTVLLSGTYEFGDGKTAVYTIEPKTGYRLKTVKVDEQTVTLPSTNGGTSTVTLDGPSGSQKTGTLKNLGNGKYSFTFPDNNYNHNIHVDWDADNYFIKEWIPEDANSITITAKPYTFNGTSFAPASGVNNVTFTVNKNDSNVVIERNPLTGKMQWVIKKTGLDIELLGNTHPETHDHIEPLYWFAEESEPSGYTLLGYDNSRSNKYRVL